MKLPQKWIRNFPSPIPKFSGKGSPTLLGGDYEPPTEEDLRSYLVKLIDDGEWDSLASDAGVTDKSIHARSALDKLILFFNKTIRNGITPSEARKELKKWAKQSDKLIKNITNDRGSNVLWNALFRAGISGSDKTILGWDMDEDLSARLQSLHHLKEWFSEAEKPVLSKDGPNDLCRLIKQLDDWQRNFGGDGLVRTSDTNKLSKSSGRAEGHLKFAGKIVELTGIQAGQGAIDEAMKIVITARHNSLG